MIQPGKPTQNAYIESFNGKFRGECLNENWFTSLAHARAVIVAWRRDYNQVRSHSAIGNFTPAAFAATFRDQGFAKPTPSDKLANQGSTKSPLALGLGGRSGPARFHAVQQQALLRQDPSSLTPFVFQVWPVYRQIFGSASTRHQWGEFRCQMTRKS
jgi:putative transposase